MPYIGSTGLHSNKKEHLGKLLKVFLRKIQIGSGRTV